jgi:predicted esterase
MAGVCAAAGLTAMIVAPAARSETPGGPRSQASARADAAPAVGAAWIEAGAPFGKALVYAPRDASVGAAKPVTVLLHGMCGDPRNACAPFADVTTARSWLVCPRAEVTCNGAGASWRLHGEDDAHLVEATVQATATQHAGEVDATAGRVLVGFSLGGIAAVQIAQSLSGGSSGTYEGLVVIESLVHPDAALLKRAGVKRVVLAAADLDMTSAPLRADAKSLAAKGLPTIFVSLGQYGHGYPPDIADRMHDAMQWVGGEDEASHAASIR